MTDTLGDTLDRLWQVIESRRGADPAGSYTAKLLSRGKAKVAQKFGEEAVEAVIEGVRGDRAALVGESADVLYHLLVMWAATGVGPADVAAELARREGISGLSEKKARKEWGLRARRAGRSRNDGSGIEAGRGAGAGRVLVGAARNAGFGRAPGCRAQADPRRGRAAGARRAGRLCRGVRFSGPRGRHADGTRTRSSASRR